MLRQAGTERPYTGEYWDTHTARRLPVPRLRRRAVHQQRKVRFALRLAVLLGAAGRGTVRYIHDRTLGMERIEVRCANCDSHLGHVFEGEGYGTPTDQRFCINSVSLKLVPAREKAPTAGTRPVQLLTG